MIGHWTGAYTGMNKNLIVTTNLDSIPFEFFVESFEKDKFNGFIEDRIFHLTDKFGMHGNIKGNSVEFKKYKTPNQGAGNDFITTEIDKNVPVILYSGKFNEDRTEVKGEWKFKLEIIFLFGFIPIPKRRSKGTWSMKYVDVK